METKEIFELFERFEKSSLTEICIKKGDVEVILKKGADTSLANLSQAHIHHQAATSNSLSQHAERDPSIEIIVSPMVGTFFRAPAPDAPPFAEVGNKVKTGQTLCMLEAMKLMNELEVEFDCEIINILVENGTMVEFGTPLFEVRRL